MKKRLIFLMATVFFIFGMVGSVNALTIDLMVGDDDGYGQGLADGADLPSLALPADYRSAAEALSTNGAEQTDFYSTNYNPLADPFDVVFDYTETFVSASLTIDMGGFQADQFGAFAVFFNGVLQADLFDFQDGAYSTVVRSFAIDGVALAAANAADQFVMTIARNNSSDATSFDYFKLTGETAPVPEPATMLLFGLGILGIAGVSRKKLNK